MRIFDARTVAALVPPRRWIDTMEQALTTALGGDYHMPPRPHFEYQGNTLLLMPCFAGDYFATKLVSVFPGNAQKGLPAVYGTVILNDGTSGEPLAMFNGAAVTALRTGAVGGVGVRHLAPPAAAVLGVVGAGVQGLHQTLMACQERPIDTVWVFDPNGEQAARFGAQLAEWLPRIRVHAAPSVEALMAEAQIVITATTALQPVLPDIQGLLSGKTYIGIGSFRPQMQELPDSLFQMAQLVFCDTEHALTETGDIINPLNRGLIEKSQVIPGGRLISGEVTKPDSRVQIWKSVGMALFDLAAVVMLYEAALEQDAGQTIEV